MPATTRKQRKFMGMVHAAQKGEKPASPEVAKVAKGISKKAAKDFASTKHKGLPEKKKQKIKETLEKIDQLKELISEDKKKMKGEDPCWKGYEMVGTKKKGGKEVPNCVPKNEDIEESGLQYYTGKKKYGKSGMTALAKAGRKGASEEELGRIKDKYKKVKENKKDDLPFDGGEEVKGPYKDKYGNIIKTKNMAKHLAKKGRAAAEEEAKKKKETVKEGWNHDSLASRLFETFKDYHDHEASMAKAQLMRIAEQSIELFKMIQEGDNLEGWVAAKITKANDYINSVHQNLAYDEASNDTMEEGRMSDIDIDLQSLADRGDEEDLIAALQGDMGPGTADVLQNMMEELKDELASKGMNDVMNDQDKMIEMLWDKLVDEYGNRDMEQPMEVVDYLYDEDDYISELRKNLEKKLNS